MAPPATYAADFPKGKPAVPIQQVRHWVAGFLTALHQRGLYPAGHPAATQALGEVEAGLACILEENEALQLAIIGERVLFPSYASDGREFRLEGGLKELRTCGVEHIAFRRGVVPREIESLFDLLLSRHATGEVDDLQAALTDADVRHIWVGRLAAEERDGRSTNDGHVARRLYQRALGTIEEIHRIIAEDRTVPVDRAREIVHAIVDDHRHGSQLQALTWLKSHDDYTYTHVLNVCILTVAQARTLSVPEGHLNAIGVAALLHDTGKCFVPPELIRKPGKLTPEEFNIVKAHPVLGAKLLRTIPHVDDLTVLVAYEHHMRFDGGGYPSRVHLRPLNLISRMCTIADYYDALRTIRSYKSEITPDEALRIMSQGAGTILDPVLFKHFVNMVGPYPSGCLVELSDGTLAVVVTTHTGFPTRPTVRSILDSEGQTIPNPKLYDLRRSQKHDRPLEIRRAVDPNTVAVAAEDYL
jgi:HD-GYP domain-containing protein (c-di-GMP phosphodiesterase class II)